MKLGKILVTGGAGFIGSNLVESLQRDYDITIINNFSSNKKILKDFPERVIKKDISYPFELEEKFDIIFHLASITDTTFPNDEEMMRQNIEGFKNIVTLAKKNNSKLIYASSAGTYGNGPIPMKESQKMQPLNAYAKSKLLIDKLAEQSISEINIIGLKYFNVFGPGEKWKGKSASTIYQLAQQIFDGKNPKIFKFGEQMRDHIYIKDVISASIKAIDAKSGIYNVGTGSATSFNDLIGILNEILNTDRHPEYIDNPYEKVYQNHTQADTTKAKQELNFKAEYTLEEGIYDYMKWLKKIK